MRLEGLGLTDVFDYAGGKKDWLAEGMPVEGERADELRAGAVARTNPPTCRPETTFEELTAQGDLETWGSCVVTAADGTVLGLIAAEMIGSAPPDQRVNRVMESAPRTIRPDASLEHTLHYLDDNSLHSVLITTSRGRLLGVLFADDLRNAL